MDSVRARTFIDETFRRAYGTDKAAGYGDYAIACRHGAVRAALGYRRAGTQPLFLEAYLDEPIESIVSAKLGRPITRDAIVEIGNLAADNAWQMISLWGEAANDLGSSSEVVVATLTAPLRRMFARIGIPVHELAPADPARLDAAAGEWGSYYRTDPRVCAGSIVDGQRAIAAFLARRGRAA
uniref:thermostable hemolysin n=1 Tax=Altererythrobacter segetis TaxID=1104773 RepID=UPI00140AFC3C|nr:thermostable hemolysin [Altererythrobacter segetis]